jgi:hypothetical protein
LSFGPACAGDLKDIEFAVRDATPKCCADNSVDIGLGEIPSIGVLPCCDQQGLKGW